MGEWTDDRGEFADKSAGEDPRLQRDGPAPGRGLGRTRRFTAVVCVVALSLQTVACALPRERPLPAPIDRAEPAAVTEPEAMPREGARVDAGPSGSNRTIIRRVEFGYAPPHALGAVPWVAQTGPTPPPRVSNRAVLQTLVIVGIAALIAVVVWCDQECR